MRDQKKLTYTLGENSRWSDPITGKQETRLSHYEIPPRGFILQPVGFSSLWRQLDLLSPSATSSVIWATAENSLQHPGHSRVYITAINFEAVSFIQIIPCLLYILHQLVNHMISVKGFLECFYLLKQCSRVHFFLHVTSLLNEVGQSEDIYMMRIYGFL